VSFVPFSSFSFSTTTRPRRADRVFAVNRCRASAFSFFSFLPFPLFYPQAACCGIVNGPTRKFADFFFLPPPPSTAALPVFGPQNRSMVGATAFVYCLSPFPPSLFFLSRKASWFLKRGIRHFFFPLLPSFFPPPFFFSARQKARRWALRIETCRTLSTFEQFFLFFSSIPPPLGLARGCRGLLPKNLRTLSLPKLGKQRDPS